MPVRPLGREDPPGEDMYSPLQYSCLENSMDGGARWATVYRVCRVRHDWETELAISALLLEHNDKRTTLTAVFNARPCVWCALLWRLPTSSLWVTCCCHYSGEKGLQRGEWDWKACWRSRICRLCEEEEGILWVNGVSRDLAWDSGAVTKENESRPAHGWMLIWEWWEMGLQEGVESGQVGAHTAAQEDGLHPTSILGDVWVIMTK